MYRANHLLVAVLFSAGLIAPGPGHAAADIDRDAADFVIANTYFVLLHEFGHALIDDFDIPILGIEENAADTLAATVMIRADQRDNSRSFRYREMLAMAAESNRLQWQSGLEESHIDDYYWTQHGLSIQRHHRIACLIYGSNVEELAIVAEVTHMPAHRADYCADEYRLADRALTWVLETYASLDESAEGVGSSIEVYYEDPSNASHAALLQIIQGEGVVETTANVLEHLFDFPDDAYVDVMSCSGQPNAYWEANDRTLVICYELLEMFLSVAPTERVREIRRALPGS